MLLVNCHFVMLVLMHDVVIVSLILNLCFDLHHSYLLVRLNWMRRNWLVSWCDFNNRHLYGLVEDYRF